jgi:hypothetical protein
MRDFRDAKAMARALRDALKAKAIEITHAEALELIAKAFGCKSWNNCQDRSCRTEAQRDERWLSPSGTRHRHGERADPLRITRDYIDPARLAVNDIGYEQRGFRWEKASIKVYLHGQSVDTAQGVVFTADRYAPHSEVGSLARQPEWKVRRRTSALLARSASSYRRRLRPRQNYPLALGYRGNLMGRLPRRSRLGRASAYRALMKAKGMGVS